MSAAAAPWRPDGACLMAAVLALIGVMLPGSAGAIGLMTAPLPLVLVLVTLAVAAYCAWRPRPGVGRGLVAGAAAVAGSIALLTLAGMREASDGTLAGGAWIFLVALAFLAWRAMERLAMPSALDRVTAIVVPAVFGVWLLYVWQVLVVGFGIPQVLLPAPATSVPSSAARRRCCGPTSARRSSRPSWRASRWAAAPASSSPS